VQIESVRIRKVLTRATGYLLPVVSHSLQPYRGCSFGNALCGVGCYVRHNAMLLRGRPWGGFLEVRENAAESYLEQAGAERRWARGKRGSFSIFLSSATDPFVPQEARYGVTRAVLRAMRGDPPDELVVQTHSHRVADALDLLRELDAVTRLRVHVTVETDRERIPGLPPHATPIERRLEAAARIREAGIRTVVTVSPLLPIASPDTFFARIAEAADAVVIDHFIGGDGTPDGRRTLATPVPAAMARLDARSTMLGYRDAMVAVAARYLPGRVGVGSEGFAGRSAGARAALPRARPSATMAPCDDPDDGQPDSR